MQVMINMAVVQRSAADAMAWHCVAMYMKHRGRDITE